MADINVITIDGPTASGKGAVSQRVAEVLGWNLLDSGAIYRALALYAKKNGVNWEDEHELARLAQSLPLSFEPSATDTKILLDNEDVTADIRCNEMSQGASIVSGFSKVREQLLERQRAFKAKPGLVADGRDMGTVVFPEASYKFYITADVIERAKRRQIQLLQKGTNVMLEALIEQVKARDERDMNRQVAPLKPAKGAVKIDTTHLGIDDVVQKIIETVDVYTKNQ